MLRALILPISAAITFAIVVAYQEAALLAHAAAMLHTVAQGVPHVRQ